MPGHVCKAGNRTPRIIIIIIIIMTGKLNNAWSTSRPTVTKRKKNQPNPQKIHMQCVSWTSRVKPNRLRQITMQKQGPLTVSDDQL